MGSKYLSGNDVKKTWPYRIKDILRSLDARSEAEEIRSMPVSHRLPPAYPLMPAIHGYNVQKAKAMKGSSHAVGQFFHFRFIQSMEPIIPGKPLAAFSARCCKEDMQNLLAENVARGVSRMLSSLDCMK